jgi:hypothetical protein
MGTSSFPGGKGSGPGTNHQSPSSAKVTEKVGLYRVALKSLVRPTSRCILFDGENIAFDASFVIYIYIYIYIYIVLIFLQL